MEVGKKKVNVEVMVRLKYEGEDEEFKGFWDIGVEILEVDNIPMLGGIERVNYNGKIRLIDALVLDGVFKFLEVLNSDAINRQLEG